MSVEFLLWALSELASMSGCPTYSLQSVDGDVESHTTEVASTSSAGAAGGSGQPPTTPSPTGELLRSASLNIPQARTSSPELNQVRMTSEPASFFTEITWPSSLFIMPNLLVLWKKYLYRNTDWLKFGPPLSLHCLITLPLLMLNLFCSIRFAFKKIPCHIHLVLGIDC